MDVATLVIAVIGVVLATLSLSWQAVTFLLSGPRVRVYLREGLRGPQGVMLAPSSIYTEQGRQTLEDQGYTEEVLGVEAVNHGRLPATVQRWSIKFENGAALSHPNHPLNPELPYRLDSHSSAIWYAPREHLELLQAAFVDQGAEAARARGEVDLADRKTLTSKNAVTVRAAESGGGAASALQA